MVWIHFRDANIGRQQRAKFNQQYDINISPEWTPICRIAKPLAIPQNKSCITIRKQFPVQLACARTIHRTQGLTLEKMAFDPSGISQHGLIYTTLSRVRNINALYILQRLTKKNFNVNKKI